MYFILKDNPIPLCFVYAFFFLCILFYNFQTMPSHRALTSNPIDAQGTFPSTLVRIPRPLTIIGKLLRFTLAVIRIDSILPIAAIVDMEDHLIGRFLFDENPNHNLAAVYRGSFYSVIPGAI